ncbi:TonB-dependent receptor [Flavobacterium urocaniciphilum]|uniref:TonB dependent receptor n=1 Tax=Flavobacterium urocaniciphilum TaxID=1299341 RepID=A0A1H9CYM2_9FLAO|nr:TonB-dependent receptor [Flavobacterium urocaniciphilum]SEQ06239.1 TonB dependent receptor [Flavobacterium urocaniciphilum]
MKKVIFSIIAIAATQFGFSQKEDENIGSEIVNIVKPYTPTISDAFKVKQMPAVEEEVVEPKIPIKYQIFSFPVASTFVPSKGRAADVDKEELEKGFANYVSLGAGNYGTVNGEVFLAHQLSKTDYVGGLLRHLSSQGGIKDVALDDKYYNTGLDFTYGSRTKDMNWNVDLGVKNQIVNWYGLPTENIVFDETTINLIEEMQSYNTISLGGRMEFNDGLFNDASMQFKRFSDKFGSGENRFFVKPSFDFEVMDSKIKASFIVDYVGGNFEKDYNNVGEMKYSNVIFGTKPSFLYQQDDFSVHLGAGLFYTTNKFNETSDGKFFVYPNIKASYRLVGDLMIAYAGAEGNLNQNSYADFVDGNPFVSPTLFVAPTDNSYDLYVGLKGKLANAVSFNVRGGLNNEKNKPFFVSNTYDETILDKKGYHYGNSFNVVYDDLTTVTVFGEIKADFSKSTTFGISGTYNLFKVSNMQEAWNMPQLKVESSLDIDFTQKWYGGVQLFFVGERLDLVTKQELIFPLASYIQEKVTLDSYFDLNAHVGYKFNKRLTFFLKGNNLANQQYNRWANFPVQGVQVLGGASYKFDF